MSEMLYELCVLSMHAKVTGGNDLVTFCVLRGSEVSEARTLKKLQPTC